MELPFRIDLAGRVAVVTGGGGVLGGVMAEAMAACGATVVVLSRQRANAAAVADHIVAAGHRAIAMACDITSEAEIEAVRGQIEAKAGVCDILINAAGGNAPGATAALSYMPAKAGPAKAGEKPQHFFDLHPGDMKQLMDVNYTGTVLACHAFGRGMVAQGRGNIINISSMAALTPLTRIPAYSSAKSAVSNFTQWLGVHLAKTGVRVNAIAPGFFITRQNRPIMLDPQGNPTARGQTILDHTPMGRYGQPEELLGALLWLLCDKASGFVTGTIVPIDGGFHAHAGV